jgi:hypothetical protein
MTGFEKTGLNLDVFLPERGSILLGGDNNPFTITMAPPVCQHISKNRAPLSIDSSVPKKFRPSLRCNLITKKFPCIINNLRLIMPIKIHNYDNGLTVYGK